MGSRIKMAYDVAEVRNEYKILFETSLDLIYIHDFKGNFLDANDIALKTLGYKKEDIPNLSFKNLIDKNQMITALNTIIELKNQGKQAKLTEYKLKTKDGNFIYIETYGIPLKKNGEFYGILGFGRNITERKNSEKKLKESELKFRTITEQSLMGVLILQDGALKYINEAVSKIGEYSIQELMGWSYNEFAKAIHPEDLQFVMEQLKKKQLGETDVVEQYPCRMFTKSGKLKWVELYSKSILYQGKPADFITLIDITEKKQAEQALRESEERLKKLTQELEQMVNERTKDLRKSEERFKGLFKWIPSPTYIWQKVENDLVLIDYNIGAEKITEGNIKRFLGIKATELYEERQDILEDLNRCINVKINFSREMKYKFKSLKHEKFLSVDYGFVPPDLVLVLTQDITDKRIAEQKLRESEEKFRHLFETSPFSILLVDLEGIIRDCNPSNEKLYGFKKDEFIGKNFYNILPLIKATELQPFFQDRFKKVFAGETTDPIEIPSYNKDDLLVWVNLQTSLVKLGEKKFVQVILQDISEKKNVEKQLKKLNRELEYKVIERTKELEMSETKFRQIFESIPDLFFLVDEKSAIIDYRGKREEFYVPPEEFLGKKLVDVLPFDLGKTTKEMIARTISSKQPQILEYSLPMRGETHYYEARLLLFFENRVAIFIRDITERKIAEIKLKESEENYKTLVMTSPDAIVVTDLKGKIIEASERASELYGAKDVSEFLGKDSFDMIIPEDRERALKGLSKTLKEGFVRNMEYNFLRKDGSSYIGELNASLIKDVNGNPKSFIGTTRDISDRKKAEVKLKQSEEKYSNLFHHSNDGIFLHDLDGNIIDVNLKVLYQFGYSKPEIFSLKIGDLHPAESLEKSRRAFQEISQKGFVNFEINFKKKDGEIFPADVSSSLFEIGGKKVIQKIVRDITERKEAEQKLKESEEKLRKQNIELKRLDELKNDFITIAAHELKTPMVSIKGYTDYILTHYKDLDFEIRKDLSLIERNSNRLNMLIDQILDVMKIDAKKMEIIREEKNIFELIQNCVDELSFQIKEKKMKIILDVQKGLHLSVDPNRIYQVFTNLLSNAIKYTSIGGEIEISAKKKNNRYLFKVKDEGRGLSIGEIKRLFNKFEVIGQEATDISYGKKGLGIGLYISKGVVEAHGGKIWGTSKGRGKGAEFYFTLPILES